ncbi:MULTISPECIES: hypothetical protein [Ralstonia solanacearum species complex]|uniref:hypothetical protein n=1 Tax=Ralstonia solanacearum species complex TaxID=3116862 RepID=UPI0013C35B94|nr:hypothetical protein [Ralstonia solanacearum]
MWFFVHIGVEKEQADCIGPSPRQHWAGGLPPRPRKKASTKLMQDASVIAVN